ncbi:unnamed protein product [Coffea canephora]|uniref:DH200=94 genomic scaffold, scaffold_718 n=1 Tax=Coffea canephora TaxID=49390 RepID=A0A068VGW2_COFCA|nr:unnamed protein product [Coffea canephora]
MVAAPKKRHFPALPALSLSQGCTTYN